VSPVQVVPVVLLVLPSVVPVKLDLSPLLALVHVQPVLVEPIVLKRRLLVSSVTLDI
jgi:hypothetical protein